MDEQIVDPTDHIQLAQLVIEISWRIDRGQASTVHELFVDGGKMSFGQTRLLGRDAIRQWGRNRDAATYRTRHVCSGMRFVRDGSDAAEGTSVLTLFMAGGDGPGSSVPFSVGEDRDQFVRTNEGWRFVSRVYEEMFVREP